MLPRDPLDLVYLGNPLRGWLTALGVFAGVFLALLLARRALVRRLDARASATAGRADDLVLALARRTSRLFFLAVAAAAARKALFDLPADVKDAVVLVARIAFYLQAARWANTAVGFWVAHLTRRRAEHDKASLATLNLLGLLARVALGAVLLLLALDALGVNITALVTGLGVAGVAVALAVQNVLGDLLASLAIALDKPFVIGDTITFDQYTGTVEDIGLKTTRLRAPSGEQLIVANAELLKSRIRNFQRQAERRVQFTLAFPLDAPPAALARVPALVREVVAAEPAVRFDRSHVSGVSEQSVTVESVYVVTTADHGVHMDVQQRVLLGLLERLADEGVPLAVPTRAVVVRGGGAPGALPPSEASPAALGA
jgi:small-conductance mechanosensitive channel